MTCRDRVLGFITFCVLVASASGTTFAAEFETKHYRFVTDVRREDAKEAVLRLDRAYEEFSRYFSFLANHKRDPKEKLRAVLVTTKPDYLRAGGLRFADACYKINERMLLVLFNDKTDWYSVTHEVAHQFTHEVIKSKVRIPTFFDEGLATYLGHGLFTGDGYQFGRVQKWQVEMYRDMFNKRRFVQFDRLFNMTQAEWNHHYKIELYHQSWSIVHYLLHSTSENRRAFEKFLAMLGEGTDAKTAWQTTVSKDDNAFLNGWKKYWDAHPGANEAEFEKQATVLTTVSALARANATFGQRIGNLEAFFHEAQSQRLQLKDTPETWLPPSMLLNMAAKRDRTAKWQLTYDNAGNPVVTVRPQKGPLLEARMVPNEDGAETRLFVRETN